jgi:hypothetical protein
LGGDAHPATKNNGGIEMESIFRNSKISINALKYNADNETLSGAALDMTGYDSVIFIGFAMSGEAFATHAVKVQGDDDSGFTAGSTLAGTSVTYSTTTAATGHGLGSVEVHEPGYKWVRALVTVPNFTTARAAGCIAIQFNKKDQPYATNTGELHVSPAAGAA